MDKRVREKIESLRQTPVTFHIGKMGLTEKIIKHLDERLKTKDVLKGRILKSAFETVKKDELISTLRDKLKLNGLEIRGYTVIIYRRKSKKQ